MHDVLIVGGGIGGLTLALELHRAGIPSRLLEAAPDIRPVGVGINLLPHATRVLAELGLEPALARVAVETAEACFYNRYGQLIYKEPLGRRAGYESPQFSIHRADLQGVLLEACRQRLGPERLRLGARCVRLEQEHGGVAAVLEGGARVSGAAAIGCDGIHSGVRKQLYPHEGEPRYSGVNMWRGVTRWKPCLSGASMVRAGWLATGKMVIYPIRDRIDAEGRQLVNWVFERETASYQRWDWNRPARVEDFIDAIADWRFDWLDVPAMVRAADLVLEYPMVDKDPLPAWSFGRISLLGDAAHPMYPRGSNGAGQAILDARALAACLKREPGIEAALKAYEAERLAPTAKVVLENRRNPPDAILRLVYERTGDRPFEHIDAVAKPEELAALSEGYKRVAGYDKRSLRK
jgi:2-polyprenyl-6-methoxyphenol hydroxylase-like FAD-dependent oxidoreductase